MKKILFMMLAVIILVNSIIAVESSNLVNLGDFDFYWEVENDVIRVYRHDENKIYVRTLDKQFNAISEKKLYALDEEIFQIRYNMSEKNPAFTVQTENSTIIVDNINKDIRVFSFPKDTFVQYRNGKNIIITDFENKQVSSYCTDTRTFTKTININKSLTFTDNHIIMFRTEGRTKKRILDFYDSNLKLVHTFTSDEIPELRKVDLVGTDNIYISAIPRGNEDYLSLNFLPKFRKGILMFLPTHDYVLNFSINDGIKLISKQQIKSTIFNFRNDRPLRIIDDKIVRFLVSSKKGSGLSVYDFNAKKSTEIYFDDFSFSGFLCLKENGNYNESILALSFNDNIKFYDFDLNTGNKNIIYTYGDKSDTYPSLNRLEHHINNTYAEITLMSQKRQLLRF